MRDKLIHEYRGVDLRIVWVVAKEELPPVKPLIEKVLKDIEKAD
ncbi:MAG: HepT-like ribonuclease domain-containing protein [Dehalococcoidia bacterium]